MIKRNTHARSILNTNSQSLGPYFTTLIKILSGDLNEIKKYTKDNFILGICFYFIFHEPFFSNKTNDYLKDYDKREKNFKEFKLIEAEQFEDSLKIFKELFPLWLYNQVLIIADFYKKLDYD